MKEWLKSVLNYRSYPEIKLGIRFFGPVHVSVFPKVSHFVSPSLTYCVLCCL